MNILKQHLEWLNKPIISDADRRKLIGETVAAMLPPVIVVREDGKSYVDIEATLKAKEEMREIFNRK